MKCPDDRRILNVGAGEVIAAAEPEDWCGG
jgi:hypothetical protein